MYAKQTREMLESMTSISKRIKLKTDNNNNTNTTSSSYRNIRLFVIVVVILCIIKLLFDDQSVLDTKFLQGITNNVSTEVVRTRIDNVEPVEDDEDYDNTRKTKTKTKTTLLVYQPGIHEELIIDNMIYWGWDETNPNLVQSACTIYTNSTLQIHNDTSIQNRNKENSKSATSSFQLSKSLQNYIIELEEYTKFVTQFTPVHDIRFFNGIRSQMNIHQNTDTDTSSHINTICQKLKPSSNGLPGIFRSQGLSSIQRPITVVTTTNDDDDKISSATVTKARKEYMEPLLPPLRHPSFCLNGDKHLFNMGYLIHDFESICYKQIQYPTSRNVFIDMGASYEFHNNNELGNNDPDTIPSIHLINLFTKFGFPFDHIYGYEMSKIDPINVYKSLPEQYHSVFHWINIPVSTESTDYTFDNPLQLILDNFNEDDLIIVKLDIDTPHVEMSFIKKLLQYQYQSSLSTTTSTGTDNNTNFTKYSKLIDHFYFEHHVVLQDLLPWWSNGGVDGSVASSLQLFQQLRKQGIAAHYWP